jgi:hypothetical protein
MGSLEIEVGEVYVESGEFYLPVESQADRDN